MPLALSEVRLIEMFCSLLSDTSRCCSAISGSISSVTRDAAQIEIPMIHVHCPGEHQQKLLACAVGQQRQAVPVEGALAHDDQSDEEMVQPRAWSGETRPTGSSRP